MHILGLTGCRRSGKDTVADYLVQHFGFIKASIGGPVHEISHLILTGLGYSDKDLQKLVYGRMRDTFVVPEIGMTVRDLQVKIGMNGRDLIHPDLWVNIAKRRFVRDVPDNCPGIVNTSIRFANEAEFYTGMGGVIARVVNDRAEADNPAKDCKSEQTHLVSHTVEIINNGSIENLHHEVNDLMHFLETGKEKPLGVSTLGLDLSAQRVHSRLHEKRTERLETPQRAVEPPKAGSQR